MTDETGNKPLALPRVTLRIARNSMSFAIVDSTAINGLAYDPYVVRSGMSMAANLREAFNNSPILSQGFQRAQVLIDTPVMLIPLEEFDDEDSELLFRHTFTGHESDEIPNTVLPMQNAVAVYPINKDIKLVLTDHFSDIKILPLMQPVWNYMHKRSFTGVRKKLYAYFRGKQLDLFSFTQNRFTFCNSYDVMSHKDASYFILYVWKQLGLDNREDELYLSGNIPDREDLTTELKQYVQKIYAVNPTAEFNRAPITQIKGLPFDLMTLFLKGR